MTLVIFRVGRTNSVGATALVVTPATIAAHNPIGRTLDGPFDNVGDPRPCVPRTHDCLALDVTRLIENDSRSGNQRLDGCPSGQHDRQIVFARVEVRLDPYQGNTSPVIRSLSWHYIRVWQPVLSKQRAQGSRLFVRKLRLARAKQDTCMKRVSAIAGRYETISERQ
jgi:hypothetical protein